jgi:hypothetical protein
MNRERIIVKEQHEIIEEERGGMIQMIAALHAQSFSTYSTRKWLVV